MGPSLKTSEALKQRHTKMKTASTTTKTLLAMIVMSAGVTALSLPAQAAPLRHPAAAVSHYDTQASSRLDTRIQSLKSDLNQGKRSGRISKKEAIRLSGKINTVASLKRTYARSGRGLTQPEIATLNAKVDTLSGQIHTQAHDNNRR